MKKTIMVILPILSLSLLFGCSGLGRNVSLKTLLPELDDFGFVTQEIKEFSKDELSKLYGAIATQFNIPVSKAAMKKVKSVPVGMAIGRYLKGKRTVGIKVFKYKDGKGAEERVGREAEESKEFQSRFQRPNSPFVWQIKETKVNGRKAYYQIFGKRTPGQEYETKLFWANGPYSFEINTIGEVWPETEIIKIAKRIGQ